MGEVAEERARLRKRDRRLDNSQRVAPPPGVKSRRVFEARPGLGQRTPFLVGRERDREEGEGERGAFEDGSVEEEEEQRGKPEEGAVFEREVSFFVIFEREKGEKGERERAQRVFDVNVREWREEEEEEKEEEEEAAAAAVGGEGGKGVRGGQKSRRKKGGK